VSDFVVIFVCFVYVFLLNCAYYCFLLLQFVYKIVSFIVRFQTDLLFSNTFGLIFIFFSPSLLPGTFLTTAQKDAQKKNELRLQSLRDAGYTVPVIKEAVVGADKEKSGSMVKGGKNGKKVVEKKVEEEEEDEEKVCICLLFYVFFLCVFFLLNVI
jgi:hypothetical protein